METRPIALISLGLLILGLFTSPAAAVLMPLVETFDDDPLGNVAPTSQGEPWIEMADNAWTIEDASAAGHVYRCEWGPTNYAHSFLQVPNAPGNNFAASVDFGIHSFEVLNPPSPVSVSLTGLQGGVSGGFTVRYYMANGETPSQEHHLVLIGPDGVAVSLGVMEPVLQTPGMPLAYTMGVTAEYATPGDPSSELTLTAFLTDGNTTMTASSVASTPSPGDQFGLLVTGNIVGYATATVDFDNFQITPEPATLSLLALAGLALLRRRR